MILSISNMDFIHSIERRLQVRLQVIELDLRLCECQQAFCCFLDGTIILFNMMPMLMQIYNDRMKTKQGINNLPK